MQCCADWIRIANMSEKKRWGGEFMPTFLVEYGWYREFHTNVMAVLRSGCMIVCTWPQRSSSLFENSFITTFNLPILLTIWCTTYVCFVKMGHQDGFLHTQNLTDGFSNIRFVVLVSIKCTLSSLTWFVCVKLNNAFLIMTFETVWELYYFRICSVKETRWMIRVFCVNSK